MQQTISKEQMWEKLNLLDFVQQQSVMAFIDSLLKTERSIERRDKNRLLALSVWTDEDLRPIEEAQERINAWPHLPKSTAKN
ncbi:MAG: hypothetical protein R3A44_33375 [Caldilineaceae bacterium]